MYALTCSMLASFEGVAFYDRLRLSIYRARGRRGHRIRIEDVGRSTLLRFDDVGYFNLIYSRNDEVCDQLPEIERFYRGSPYGCRLLSAGRDEERLAEACRGRGWVPGESLAWLSGPPGGLASRQRSRFLIERARPDEGPQYFRTYLEAFEAAPERMAGAIENMCHLFGEPRLHFLRAAFGVKPVGIGMLLCLGGEGLLCAGAVLPVHRRRGVHSALVLRRLELASRLGCRAVHSWAVAGGQSHRNMTRLGLRTMATSRVWHWREPRT